MFSAFENYVKKNSLYIFVDKVFLVIGIFYTIIACVLLCFHAYVYILITYILTLLLIYIILLIKQNVRSIKEWKNSQIDIQNQEYECVRQYIITNQLYDKDNIKNFIEHYRFIIGSCKRKVDFCTLITTIASLGIFADKGYKNALIFIVILAIIYKAYSSVSDMYLMMKGELGLYMRLEEIFSKIYAECINEHSNNLEN